MNRRLFLTGVGGSFLALPMLESLSKRASARDAEPAVPLFVMRTGNGVQQADGDEPDRFWPVQTGELTRSLLRDRDAGRCVSELASYADRLVLVKGSGFAFEPVSCGHAQAANQLLTATEPLPASNYHTYAAGESIDTRVARTFAANHGEPLALYTGPRVGYLEEVLSYRGPAAPRAAEDSPLAAFQRLVGGTGGFDPNVDRRRTSINDLVRAQLVDLRSRGLSGRDRERLDAHLQAVRDFEIGFCELSDDLEQRMALLDGQGTLNDNRIAMAELHLELVALAFACGAVRAATLQVGDGNDSTEYTIDGERYPSFHFVSHRIYSNEDQGAPILGAVDMHHQIDRLHARLFRHFLDRLDELGVLDQAVAVWCSDLGTGRSHSQQNIPWVIAGGASGRLRTGRFVDLGGVTHDRVLNTLGAACGVTNDAGQPLDDFGDARLDGGVIEELLA